MQKTRLRALWRSAREIPLLGAPIRLADRVWWWRTIARSDVVDTDFYAAQCGRRRMSRALAIWHYVSCGFRHGLSVNPLFDEVHAGGGLPEIFRVPAMYAYLISDRPTVTVAPWWDAVDFARAAGVHSGLEHAWAHRDTLQLSLRAGTRELTVSVQDHREWAISAARAWAGGRPIRLDGTAQDPTFSLIRIIQAGDRNFARKLGLAADVLTREAAHVVVALVDPDASQWISAAVLGRIDPRITVLAAPARVTYADVVASATASASGDALVVVEPRADLTVSHVRRLLDLARTGSAVIPLSLAIEGTVVGVGSAHVGGEVPYRILGSHPREDVDGLGGEPVSVPMITGRTFAIPLAPFLGAGGLERDLVNDGELEILSLRLRRRAPELALLVEPRVMPVLDEPERAFARRKSARYARIFRASLPDASTEQATQLIDAAGFDVLGWNLASGAEPVPELRWRPITAGGLRWAIKICAPAGPRGAVWGDTHFARGLANALRRAGQSVVVDAFEAQARATTYLDDVTVVIRGPYRIDPPRTGIALQWIISHPDQVSKAELQRFHRVFAASTRWPEKIGREWGILVEPLLEATDVDLFHPRGLARTEDIVFVGTARGIARPSVVEPIRAGIPVKVYGPDWRPFIPAAAIAADSIPNAELSERYESASIVLNDQWPAMRREGFIAMRPFDVVAAGGRVISEDVDGIEAIFGGAVVAYRDERELVELLRLDPSELFPDDAALALIAARIRDEHSFDTRARTLVAAAAELCSA